MNIIFVEVASSIHKIFLLLNVSQSMVLTSSYENNISSPVNTCSFTKTPLICTVCIKIKSLIVCLHLMGCPQSLDCHLMSGQKVIHFLVVKIPY